MILRIAYIVTLIVMFIGIRISKAQDTLGLKKNTIFVNANNDSLYTQRPLITFRNKNGHKLAYNTMPLSNLKLSHLINEYPVVDQRSVLTKEFKKMRRYQKRYWPELIVGVGLTAGMMFIGSITAWAFHDVYIIGYASIASAIVLTATIPLSISTKHKFLKKRRQLVTLYNTSLP